MYCYRLYGMRVRSDLEFPQLCEDGNTMAPEKEVRVHKMKEEDIQQFLREHGEQTGSALNTGKSYLCNTTMLMTVERGTDIRYCLRKGQKEAYLRTYLLGFGMAMLSLQRGMLPFHCSALEEPGGGAVLIAGESGAGKSTLTAGLMRQGYRFLADDMAVVDISGLEPVVWPAFPYMKLCRDAAAGQGYDPEKLLWIDEKKDKFLVPCASGFRTDKRRLTRFLLLGKGGETVSVEKIGGTDRMIVYKENLFLRHLWKTKDPGAEVWQNCLKLAAMIPAYHIERPTVGDSTAQVAAEVHRLLGSA